jgi:hypothetical protein
MGREQFQDRLALEARQARSGSSRYTESVQDNRRITVLPVGVDRRRRGIGI